MINGVDNLTVGSHGGSIDGGQPPDIIGFGALNVDVIATASGLSELAAEQITESTARFEWNREGPTDRESILDEIRNIGTSSLNFSLGGSAWLTIYALAKMKLGLRLGYIGALGRIEAPGVSFRSQMSELGIDDRWVGSFAEDSCGLCLSFIDDNERVMHTNPGANLRMAEHLRGNLQGIAEYIASARYVHVTSFLDGETPAMVAAVLERARTLNPNLRISIDPGFDWADHPSEDVRHVLALADLLFVNYREFKALGNFSVGNTDDAVARRVLGGCRVGATVFVTKRYDFTEVFEIRSNVLQSHRFQLRRPVHETDVEDATGAGDAFSAAVLSAMASDRLRVELGGYLGLTLARHKLQSSLEGLPSLRDGFLQQKEVPVRDIGPRRVLILHDDDTQWRQVNTFLTNRCGLETEHLGPAEVAARGPEAVVRDIVSHCSFAVCILSGGEPGQGSSRPDQAIVHQVGILHGRYGFGRVAILVEDGCDLFTNLSGLIRLDFPKGRVDAKFVELRRMLLRELPNGKGPRGRI
ncbi:carbohydrate kinase family protein [Nocardia sp. NPDC058658]|uniref:carbohydrate kinase family protein n=1 Tax=Nocardia sp. NPDC058658 TaxID=3346580 RepID=UPI003663967C